VKNRFLRMLAVIAGAILIGGVFFGSALWGSTFDQETFAEIGRWTFVALIYMVVTAVFAFFYWLSTPGKKEDE